MEFDCRGELSLQIGFAAHQRHVQAAGLQRLFLLFCLRQIEGSLDRCLGYRFPGFNPDPALVLQERQRLHTEDEMEEEDRKAQEAVRANIPTELSK